MMKASPTYLMAAAIGFLLLLIPSNEARSDSASDSTTVNVVYIEGGSFEMGDLFGEGREIERPIHTVTLSDFFIAQYEVTVGQFREFIEQTGYKTSAEGSSDSEARKRILEKLSSGDLSHEEVQELKGKLLECRGAGYWDAEMRAWTGYNPLTNWRDLGIKQTDNDPVMAVSVEDAMNYCNWLSTKAGYPVAYDLETWDILDENGETTDDVTMVRGYRLPTEAEWEYAAREGGQKVRFGNGKDIARSSEINFRGDDGEYEYLETGDYLRTSTPVGSYPPNSLGLYDMSGNAWEWVSDKFATYTEKPLVNPYTKDGDGYALRGGRWGGDASEARASSRSAWPGNDRCNNSGFRIARSK